MFWWFKKGTDYLRYESREVAEGAYELRIIRPDCPERVERFEDSGQLQKRQQSLEQELSEEGWSGPHGWNV